MKKGNAVSVILGAVGMLVLIFDGRTAVHGIRAGIDMCLQTLIPSLFPFFILSVLITGNITGQSFQSMRLLSCICRIPTGTESLFIVGILGGYPMGAKSISDCYQRGLISADDAKRMTIFCNNAGPSFIFGILGSFFDGLRWIWAIWLIQISSAILTAFVFPGQPNTAKQSNSGAHISIHRAVSGAIQSMASVCGWVVLYRMILEFLNRWFLWFLPHWGQVIITGFLELSNGCLALQSISNESIRFILANLMLSMGGLSVCMQTRAVFPQLNMRTYISGRTIHAGFSLMLSLAAISLLKGRYYELLIPLTVFAIFLILLLKIRKKEVAIT